MRFHARFLVPGVLKLSTAFVQCINYNPTFMLRYFTSGESHGEALVAFLSDLPAGVPVEQDFVDRELWRRQQGYGRGGRMKIETDVAQILSGVRHGKTIGSPISILLQNKDWQNWKDALPIEEGDPAKHKRVGSPRPGHADRCRGATRESRCRQADPEETRPMSLGHSAREPLESADRMPLECPSTPRATWRRRDAPCSTDDARRRGRVNRSTCAPASR